MTQDEEAAHVRSPDRQHHHYAHFWHREARKRALYRPETAVEDNTRHRDLNGISDNAAISEFGPALVEKMDAARKRQPDLYDDPIAFYAAFHTQMRQFDPDLFLSATDATAGAMGYLMYLYRIENDKFPWRIHTSELLISDLLFNPDCLASDYKSFKQNTSPNGYELRWIHLPQNNMEWVEHMMHQLVENLVKKNSDASSPIPPDAVDLVVHHVLHPKRWTARQNDRSPNAVHARFMDSCTQQFTVASKTSAPEFSALRKRSFVLFMPYISWERSSVVTYRNIVYSHARNDVAILSHRDDGRIRIASDIAAQHTAQIPCCKREALLRNYLFTKKPLHLRRTIDQFYYTIMSDTKHRDEDQVVERYARKQKHWHLRDRVDPSILMVDHLWLWVLNKDTVLTCFPKLWNPDAEFEGSDLLEFMRERIVRKCNQNNITPGKVRIARLISETCARYLHKISKTSKCHQFMRFFEEALKKVKDGKSRFHREISSALRDDKPNYDSSFLDISQEFKALGEIMDISDEVQMILSVIDEQLSIMTKMDEDLIATRVQPEKQPRTEWRVLNKLRGERRRWELILTKASETRDEIKDLVEMKQQHATIKLATDTSDQSNSVMLFTVVTILFLPLSTLASIFGVNATEFGQGDISISTIFAYIFPLSAVIVTISCWLAFNHSARRCISLSLELFIASVMLFIPTGIFDRLAQRMAEQVQGLRNRRKEKCEKRMERKKREEHEREEQEKLEQDGRARLNNVSLQLRGKTSLSRVSTDEDDNEFEEDNNVDIVDDDRSSIVTARGASSL